MVVVLALAVAYASGATAPEGRKVFDRQELIAAQLVLLNRRLGELDVDSGAERVSETAPSTTGVVEIARIGRYRLTRRQLP